MITNDVIENSSYPFLHAKMSYSSVKAINVSIANWINHKLNPRITDAMVFGTAFELFVFNKQKFEKQFVKNPYKDRRTIQYGLLEKECNEKGMTILSEQEFLKLNEMENNLINNKIFRELFFYKFNDKNYNTGMTIEFEALGMPFKAILDVYLPASNIIIDIKTINDLSELHKAERAVIDFKLYIQNMIYKSAVRAKINKDIPKMLFIFVETTEPHGVRVIELDESWDELATAEIKNAVATYRQFVDDFSNGNLNIGYKDEIESISMPNWLNRLI